MNKKNIFLIGLLVALPICGAAKKSKKPSTVVTTHMVTQVAAAMSTPPLRLLDSAPASPIGLDDSPSVADMMMRQDQWNDSAGAYGDLSRSTLLCDSPMQTPPDSDLDEDEYKERASRLELPSLAGNMPPASRLHVTTAASTPAVTPRGAFSAVSGVAIGTGHMSTPQSAAKSAAAFAMNASAGAYVSASCAASMSTMVGTSCVPAIPVLPRLPIASTASMGSSSAASTSSMSGVSSADAQSKSAASKATIAIQTPALRAAATTAAPVPMAPAKPN